ncbi:MAG: hypothetical protein EZS28_038481, partial [Streblomastix strix]
MEEFQSSLDFDWCGNGEIAFLGQSRGEEIEGVDPYQDVIRFEKIQKLDVNTRE